MKKNSKLVASLLIGTSLLTLVSCGSDDSDSSRSTRLREEQQQDDQGIYRAVLSPLNSSVAGNVSGTIEIRIEGDDFVAISSGSGAAAGEKHLHNITLSSTCPTQASDVNGDTYVDIVESFTRTGQILIPLDSDLSNQLDGITYGPIANASGNYYHRRSTTLTDLLNDLRSPDPDTQDSIVKLPEGQNLNLTNRVILVHGVKRSSNLPDTVATIGDLSAEQSLPIACGKLVRVTDEDTTPIEPDTTTDSTDESL